MIQPPAVKNLTQAIREAALFRPYCRVYYQDLEFEALLLDFIEVGQGRSTETTELHLQVFTSFDALSGLVGAVTVDIPTSTLGLIRLTGQSIPGSEPIPTIKISNLAIRDEKDERASKRRSILDSEQSLVVLETTQDGHHVCGIKIIDIGKASVGAEITALRSSLQGLSPLNISGLVNFGNGKVVSFNKAVIARCEEIQSTQNSLGVKFKVAISVEQNKPSTKTNVGRAIRQPVKDGLSQILALSSLSGNEKICDVKLVNLSVSGFLGETLNLSSSLEIFAGMRFRLLHKVTCKAVSVEERIVRFEIDHHDLDSRLAWRELLSTLVNPEREILVAEDQYTLSVLARSGIKGSRFLSTYQTLKQMHPSFDAQSVSGSIVSHRWAYRDLDGQVAAHVGSFALGDNTWFMGDLFTATKSNPEGTIPFVREYLEHFIEFSNHQTPKPRIMTAWLKGHPYWKKFESTITNGGSEYVRQIANCKVISTGLELRVLDDCKTQVVEVVANNSKLIDKIRNKALEAGLTDFLNRFDFNSETYGSHLLRKVFKDSGFQFNRSYYYLEYKEQPYIFITSRMPEGLSPQRHQSAAWIFRLFKDAAKDGSDKAVSDLATIASTKNGCFPSLVRVVAPSDCKDAASFSSHLISAEPEVWRMLG